MIKVIVIICYLHVAMPLLETIKHRRNPFSLNIYKKVKVEKGYIRVVVVVGVVVVVELTGMVSDSNLKRYVDTAFRVYALSADSAQNVKTELKIFVFQE